MEAITKGFFLFLSNSRRLNQLARTRGSGFAAGKIIGGMDFRSSIACIKALNAQGLSVTVDHLGEFVDSPAIAAERTEECIETIKTIHDEGLDSHVSLKLTSLGLDIDRELVVENMTRILEKADQYGIMVTIDMEDFTRCQATLELFKQFKEQFEHVSTVLQAYLYRTEQDLARLSKMKPFLRLVKGAYKESARHAFHNKADVDTNYMKLIEQSLLAGNYTGIATHDENIIEFAKAVQRKHLISMNQFEFQMLYGMRTNLQQELVKQGYRVRVYVPYGRDWYGYFMRRLAERPANISFAFKGFTQK
ncbi:proline dehydrogenase family protein [Domibacillus indicus]|uniref:proline dehydrogenase family protein n=1 Tax=Domibacillus indicus TaxID=1437523 RepID=UPI000617AAF3|nr:proline dehydrogenase [Domibacillus indicus]